MKKGLLAGLLAAIILNGAAVGCPLRLVSPPTRWVNPRLFDGTLLEATYTPSPVKSVQQITIGLAGVATSNTQTITSVNVASSILLASDWDANDDGVNHKSQVSWYRSTLTNATTVTVVRGGQDGGGGDGTFKGQVVEFLPQFAKSQGCGTIPVGDGSATGTATITAVVLAKTMLGKTGMSNTFTTANGMLAPMLVHFSLALTNTTTITAARAQFGAIMSAVVGYCYLEFK